MNFVILHIMAYENGRWICPECGRVVQVFPENKILIKGDPTATHQGSTGGLSMTVSVATL